jgi:hypothetical protein
MKACFVVYKYSVPLGDACCYPLGFMYVAALYKQKGFEIKVLNYNLWEYDFKEEIKGQDIVAFTGFEEFKDLIIRDALVCKEAGIKTILGGALATFRPDLVVGHVNKLCIGEHPETSNFDVLPLPLFKNSGCSYLIVGIESFNQKKLNYVNKQLKVSDIYKTLDLLHKYNIGYHGNILVGFEYETYEDIAYEVSLIPEGSNIFPMLVQHFIGTEHGKVRRISSTQEEYLNTCFSNYISSTGRYCLRTGDKNI